jgi:protein SCO1/2
MLHPRLRLALTVAVACAAVLVAVVTLTAAQSGTSGSGGGPSQLVNGFYGTTAPPAMPAVSFTLPNQNGKPISLSRYAGQVVVLTFVYSTCQNTCPIVVEQIKGAVSELRRRVPVIAVSVDPKQDTPTDVNAFLIKEGMLGQMQYLVAPRAVLRPIWKFFGIQPQVNVNSSTSDHSIEVELLDQAGRPRVGYSDLDQMDPDAIAHDIETLQAQRPPRVARRRLLL